MTTVIVFVVTCFATALSAMSGGGASTINIPVFLMLGMPFPLAISTQKLTGVFWVPFAARNYLQGRTADWIYITVFSLLGLIGTVFGVLLVVSVDERILSRIVGVLILAFVSYTYFRHDFGLRKKREFPEWPKLFAYPFSIVLGFYEAIFGAGNAILFTLLSIKTRGHDFIEAMGSYYAVSFLWLLAAAAFLIRRGFFDLWIAVPAVAGSVVGGYIGSKYAVYKGNAFIKLVFVIIGGLLGLKLLVSG